VSIYLFVFFLLSPSSLYPISEIPTFFF
jgi:hypothetical protein